MFEWLRRKIKDAPDCNEGPLPEGRVYAVGDIHGRYDLLSRMIDRIRADLDTFGDDRAGAQVIFLGDYVDRGERSREVLNLLQDLCATGLYGGTVPVHCLMGNHEAALLGFLDHPGSGKRWLQFGGLQTISSYRVPMSGPVSEETGLRALAGDLRAAMGPHVEFLRQLPLSLRSGPVVFAHAGIDPDDPEAEGEGALLWGLSSFIHRGGVEGLRVVHGHFDAMEPVVTSRRICVDTGAYYSGRLMAVRLDDGVRMIEVGAG